MLFIGLFAAMLAACGPAIPSPATQAPLVSPSPTATPNPTATLKPTILLTSPAFADGQPVPVEYTCQGSNRSPELQWKGVPEAARSLALIVEDPDAPTGTFTHWVLANIPNVAASLAAGQPAPKGSADGKNDSGRTGYTGPCPPPGKVHHYIFTLYALDQPLQLDDNPSKASVLAAMSGHILATGQLVGTFQR